MGVHVWYVVAGALLIGMALMTTHLNRLPLTSAVVYLLIGVGLGPWGLGVMTPTPALSASFMEHVAEVAVLISLFTTGLKLRSPFRDARWRLPLRLATVAMVVTILMVTAVATFLLELPAGAALLLGAIVAPTDPVLASDVQARNAGDRDRLRFALSGEAGLNDGTAFPFVMLGLGMLGLHELGPHGTRWLLVDVVWATAGGLMIGWLLGTGVSRWVVYLRRYYQEAEGLDNFVGLGLVALTYGTAMVAHTYGFLAVFAAGLAMRGVERETTRRNADRTAVSPGAPGVAGLETAAAHLAHGVLSFNEQLERVAELTVIVILGSLLASVAIPWRELWLVPLLFLVVRPAAVALAFIGSGAEPGARRMMGWFGVRGVGSLYYMMFALTHGLSDGVAARVVGITCMLVTASIILHGITVTPLMTRYEERRRPVPSA